MMNQRIRELAEQAGIMGYGEESGTYSIPVKAFQSRMETFTQLIVQECIKELEATQVCDPYTGEQFNYYNDVLADGIASIKENFGVE